VVVGYRKVSSLAKLSFCRQVSISVNMVSPLVLALLGASLQAVAAVKNTTNGVFSNCPSSCSTLGPDSAKWDVYRSAARISQCNEMMLFDFPFLHPHRHRHHPSNRTAENIKEVRACTADFTPVPRVPSNLKVAAAAASDDPSSSEAPVSSEMPASSSAPVFSSASASSEASQSSEAPVFSSSPLSSSAPASSDTTTSSAIPIFSVTPSSVNAGATSTPACVAAGAVAKSAEIRITPGHGAPARNTTAKDLVDAARQLSLLLPRINSSCEENPISFSNRQNAILGFYAGSRAHKQGVTAQLLEKFIAHVQTKGVTDSLVFEVCERDEKLGADYVVGLAASTRKKLYFVQDTVYRWSNGSCYRNASATFVSSESPSPAFRNTTTPTVMMYVPASGPLSNQTIISGNTTRGASF